MNLEKQLASLDLRKSALDREQLFFQLGKSQTSRLPQARAFLAGAFIACLPWIMMISASKNPPLSNSFSEQVPNPVEKNPYSILALGRVFLETGELPQSEILDSQPFEQGAEPRENRLFLQQPDQLLEQP